MGRPKGFERNEVLQKAIQVFWKKGFADTSVQDLEKATGVNKSGLYSEFNDKQDLFLACLEYYVHQSVAVPTLLKEPLGWKNIENFLTMNQTCSGRKGCFGVNTIRELGILPAKAHAILTKNFESIKKAIIDNLDAEQISDASAVAEIIMVFNSGNSLALNVEDPEGTRKRVTAFLKLLQKPATSSSAHTASW